VNILYLDVGFAPADSAGQLRWRVAQKRALQWSPEQTAVRLKRFHRRQSAEIAITTASGDGG
jgi:hypothetical protein